MIHFERRCGCGHAEFWECRVIKGDYGGDWETACNVHIMGEKAHVSMFMGTPTRKLSATIRKFCMDRGVKIGEYERGDGKTRTVKYEEGDDMPDLMYVTRQGPPVVGWAKAFFHGAVVVAAIAALAGLVWVAI